MTKNDVNSKKVKVNNTKKAPLKNKGANFDESKHKSHFVLYFLLFMIIVGILAGILTSPAFNLSEVIIADGVNVKKEEIYNLISVNYEKNIFTQDFKKIKDETCTLPYIKEAKIDLILPDKFEIKYEEMVPYALIKYLESYIVADKSGYLLEVSKEKKENLPIIYGIDIDEINLGEALDDISKTKYRNVVLLLETAYQQKFPYVIEEINYETIEDVKIWVKDVDVDIVYGEIDVNQISDKLNCLTEVLNEVKNKKGKLDISSSNYFEKMIFSERID